MTAFQLKIYLAVSGVTSKWNMQHVHEVWGIIKNNNYPSNGTDLLMYVLITLVDRILT
jgi:hypothetical protein